MNISVPSRFACLKIEDDDGKPPLNHSNHNSNNKKKAENKSAPPTKKNNNSKRPSQNQSSTSSNKQKNVGNSTKKGRNKQSEAQWEEWKKKDNEIVRDYFEQDMEYAILQSKLEYEASTSMNNGGVVKTDIDSINKDKIAVKKKKNKTIQLAEFLGSGDSTSQKIVTPQNNEKKDETYFFDKMKEAATKEISKGMLEEERKERDINFEQMITLTQCQEKLQKVQLRNKELMKELKQVKSELITVKERNRTFCTILGQGEMKDKSELLLELDRLNKIKDELTEEVTHLHELLEQERSKNASIPESSTYKHKDKLQNKRTKNN